MLNYTSIANDLALSVNTIKVWTSVLETIGIIKLIYPFENNISKRLVKTPKVYFMDTGLVCYLVGWNSVESVRNGANSGEVQYIISGLSLLQKLAILFFRLKSSLPFLMQNAAL